MENSESETEPVTSHKRLNSKNAWIFPLVCWSVNLVTGLLQLRLGAFIYLVIAIAQIALLVAALYTGIRVLQNTQGWYTQNDKSNAIVGLVITGSTLLIILWAVVNLS